MTLTKGNSVAAVDVIRNVAPLRIRVTVFEYQPLWAEYFLSYAFRALVVQITLIRVWIETSTTRASKILRVDYHT